MSVAKVRLGDLLRSRSQGGQESRDLVASWREEVQSIPIDAIARNPYQPRIEFDDEQLQELAASIREHGVLHPVVVRKKGDGYELVVGERRLRACKLLEWETMPAIVREMSDGEVAEIALIENLQRENLNFFEEAEGYKRLLEEFGLTQDELAGRLGKSQSAIANKLRLLRLDPDVRKAISREMLSERHARALLKLTDPKDQMRAVDVVVQQALNVRQTEEWVEKELQGGDSRDDEKRRRRQSVKGVYTDYRLLFNSVKQLVKQMKADGVGIELNEQREDDYVELRIRVRRSDKGGR